MKLSTAVACLLGATCCVALQAAFLPIVHLDNKSVKIFDAYVEKFEREVVKPYTESGKLWQDASACCQNGALSSGRPFVEARANDDIDGGSLHHFSGAMHLNAAKIEDMRRIMEDYPSYPVNFKPDVSKASGTLLPDSSPGDDHYQAHLTLAEKTIFMNVNFETVYDTHYRSLDEHRWISKSTTTSVRELRDWKDPGKGTYPEGDDHGFIWHTNTYWFARVANGGLDLQVDSITLSRTNVPGFTWFGARRSHDAVEKMLSDAKTAIASLHKSAN
jgi:hypothetical protein